MTTFLALPSRHWTDQYMLLLPRIEKQANYAFRHLGIEARTEAVADVIANTWVAFCRLVETGKASLAYATSLARFAVAQVNEGRQVGTSTNSLDIASTACKRKHGHRIESITPRSHDDSWKSVVIECPKSGPAEVAGFRIDFEDWLSSLSPNQYVLVLQMCEGHSTSELAVNHSVSRGRISQIRRELEASWRKFSTT